MTNRPISVVAAFFAAGLLLNYTANAKPPTTPVSPSQLIGKTFAECEKLLGKSAQCDEISAELSAMFDELAHLAEALSTLGHVTPRSLDAIASYGEQLSSSLVTAYFTQCGIDAEYVDARENDATHDQGSSHSADPESVADVVWCIFRPLRRSSRFASHVNRSAL